MRLSIRINLRKAKPTQAQAFQPVVILEGKRTGADADLSDLLNDLGDEATIVGGMYQMVVIVP